MKDPALIVASPAMRRVWSSPDAVLVCITGCAAEFAANRAVDWLFVTGKVPEDPVGRFLDTASILRSIFLNDPVRARAKIEEINRVHSRVEQARAAQIPHLAYRDVLFMLVAYGERAHDIVFGPMSASERIEHYEAWIAVGAAMGIADLPDSYAEYREQRRRQLLADYAYSQYTSRLFERYRETLGPLRYRILLWIQAAMIPSELRPVLRMQPSPLVYLLLRLYRHLPGGDHKLRWLHPLVLPQSVADRIVSSL